MKKALFIILGVVTLILGIIGVVLPLLPTTPFMLLSMVCFGRGSERLYFRLKKTGLYRKYVRKAS